MEPYIGPTTLAQLRYDLPLIIGATGTRSDRRHTAEQQPRALMFLISFRIGRRSARPLTGVNVIMRLRA